MYIETIRIETNPVVILPIRRAVKRFGGVSELAEALQGHHSAALLAVTSEGTLYHSDNGPALTAMIDASVEAATFEKMATMENKACSELETLFAKHFDRTGVSLRLCTGVIWEPEVEDPRSSWPTKRYPSHIDSYGSYTGALEFFKAALAPTV